jgi:SAM-dependent methyltransferase
MEATKTGPKPQWARAAYEAIAPVYDDFTAHHDYELWLGNLLPELKRHGLRGNRLLDVGCGTGKSFLPMLARGWDVTGCDISESMLEVAKAKTDGSVSLATADMRELPMFGEFDLVWCLDDAVNYLLSYEELEQALSGMRANMAPHALLMFDVNTLQTYRSFFAEDAVVERDGRRLIWRGRTPTDAPPGCVAEASFEVEGNEGDELGAIPLEFHRERHFPKAEVLEALHAAGLECLDVFGHGEDAVLEQPLEDLRHSKAVYLAQLA